MGGSIVKYKPNAIIRLLDLTCVVLNLRLLMYVVLEKFSVQSGWLIRRSRWGKLKKKTSTHPFQLVIAAEQI